jgi:hypothetical protein
LKKYQKGAKSSAPFFMPIAVPVANRVKLAIFHGAIHCCKKSID